MRHISSAKYQFEQQFFQSIYETIDGGSKQLINQILFEKELPRSSDIISVAELKKDIAGARLKNVDGSIKKIQLLQQIVSNTAPLKNVNRKLLLKYYDRIMILSPSDVLKFNVRSKYATMIIFCYIRTQLLLDDLIDTFTKLIHKMRTKAESYVDKLILADVKRVDGKFDILEKLARANANNPKGVIEDIVYPDVP